MQKFQLQNEVSDLDREIQAYQDLRRSLRSDRDAAAVEAERNDRLAAEFKSLATGNMGQADALQASLAVTASVTETTTTSAQAPKGAAPPTPTPDPTTLQTIANLRALARDQDSSAQNYEAAAEGQRAAMAEIDRQLGERQQEMVYLLGLQEQYKGLVDSVNRAQSTYDFLSDKANEARLKLTQGQNIGYLQVVEPARLPEGPMPKSTGN